MSNKNSNQPPKRRPIPSPYSTPNDDYSELKEFIDSCGGRVIAEYIKNLTAFVAANAIIDNEFTKDSLNSYQQRDLYDAILGLNEMGRIIDEMDWRSTTYLISNPA